MTVAVTSLMPIPLDPVSADVAIGTPVGGPDSESGFAMLVAALSDGAPASNFAGDALLIDDDTSSNIVATATVNEMPPMSAVSQLQWLTQLQASDMGIFAQPKAQPAPAPQADQSFDLAAANVIEGEAPDSVPAAVTVSNLMSPPQADQPFDLAAANVPEDQAPDSVPAGVTVSNLMSPPPAIAETMAVAMMPEPSAPTEQPEPAESRMVPQAATTTAIPEPTEPAENSDQPTAPRVEANNIPAPKPAPAVAVAPAVNSAVAAQILATPGTNEPASTPPETADMATPKSQTQHAKTQAPAAAPAIPVDDTTPVEPAAPATTATVANVPPQEKQPAPKLKPASDAPAQPVKTQVKSYQKQPDVVAVAQPPAPPQANMPQAINAPESAVYSAPEADDATPEAGENSSPAVQPIPVQAIPVQTIPVADAEPVRPSKSANPAPPKPAITDTTDNSAPTQSDTNADQTAQLAPITVTPATIASPPATQPPNSGSQDATDSAPVQIVASAAKPNWTPASLLPDLKGGSAQPATNQDSSKAIAPTPPPDAVNTQGANISPAGTQPAKTSEPNTTAPIARPAVAENQTAPQNINAAPSADPQQPVQHTPAPQHFADAPASAPPQTVGVAAIAADTAPMQNGITFNPTSPADAPVRLALTAGPNGAAMADMEALALKIAARSADGDSNFQIRLDPPELGRIDVVLNVDAHGKAAAELSADSPQTLELLQKDAPALERALKESGIDLGSMSFSLKSDAQANQDRDARSSARDRAVRIGAVDAAAASAAMIGNAGLSGQDYGAGTMRLDITV